MARTRHHTATRTPFWNRDPASWRKEGNRAYRARWRQLMRKGEYVLLGHPKRDGRGWYW
jgi:hypothetical protein